MTPRAMTGLGGAVLAALLCLGAGVVPAQAGQAVFSAARGEVVLGAEPEAPRFPASLTKLMTLHLALDAVAAGDLGWDEAIPVSRHAATAPPVRLGLRVGAEIPVRTAVHAVLVRSSNDAARALAEAIAGSEAAFARRMTRRARELGMERTVFRNATGLPDGDHVSTAADMARLVTALDATHGARLRPLFRRPVSWRGASLGPRNAGAAALPGSVLGKTGFTCDGGFSVASLVERGGERLAYVVLGGASAAARQGHLAALASGEAGATRASERARAAAAPVVLPGDSCRRSADSAPPGPGPVRGWAISLGDFPTRRAAAEALGRARAAGAGLPGRIARRAGRPGHYALLMAPDERTAEERARRIMRERVRARVLHPEKVARAEFVR